MRADDPAAADPARRRLLQRSSFPHFPSFASRRTTSDPNIVPLLSPDSCTSDDIYIDDTHLPVPNDDNDLYRWAILHENQRGYVHSPFSPSSLTFPPHSITLFSTPFYSPLSLFPFDPQSFTIPNNHSSRAHQPNLSLENFPLPDGTWRWASGAWMIDMRTDRGEVQHDGFEYNWSFRDSNWHATIGKFSAGAWVRRRRWVRLMMRPANHTHAHNTPDVASTTSQTATHSTPSLLRPASNLSLADFDHHASLWHGGEQDWQHVHRLLRLLGRDGRKLELWRMWLGPYAQLQPPDIKGKAKQFDPPLPSPENALEKRHSEIVPEENPPPLVHLATLFRSHVRAPP